MLASILGFALALAVGPGTEATPTSWVVVDREGTRRVAAPRAQPDNTSTNAAVTTTDRAENGDFADVPGQHLRAWSTWAAPYGTGTGTATWTPEDATGQPGSGSLRLVNTSPAAGPREYGIQQCLRPSRPVGSSSGTLFPARLALRIPAGQNVGPGTYVAALVVFFSSDDCSLAGFEGGGGVPTFLTSGGTNGWEVINPDWQQGVLFFATSMRSALLTVVINKQAGIADPAEVLVDEVGVRGTWQPTKGDVNRDGETDLILHNPATGENAAWFMHDETRRGSSVSLLPVPPTLDWQVAGTDDFDADGEQDLLMWNALTGETEFWLMNGTDRVGAPVPLAGALPPPWKPAATADFDADGRADLLYRNSATQKLAIWTLNGTSPAGVIAPNPDQAIDPNWAVVAACDLNRDGTVDLLWYNSTSGRIVLWFMDAAVARVAGIFANPPQAGDANWQVLAAGDYGIGPAMGLPALADTVDLVWRNRTSGRQVLWFMDRAGNRTGGVFTSPSAPSPNPLDWTIVGPR